MRTRIGLVSALVLAAAACGAGARNTPADTVGTRDAGQVTDSILPGGPNGAVTSASSTPTTRAEVPATRSGAQQPKPTTRAGKERDSATQPQFSIDEKGTVRPIKH